MSSTDNGQRDPASILAFYDKFPQGFTQHIYHS